MIKDIIKIIGKNSLIVVLWMAGLIGALWVGLQLYGNWNDEWSGYNASQYVSDGYCNIAVLPVFGEVFAYAGADKDGMATSDDLPPSINPDDVERFIQSAEYDPYIVGILAELDSPGGSGAGGEIIANRFKSSSLPVAVAIRDIAASAGYQIATGADYVVALPSSEIGSIGVTMSYLDYSEQNANEGLRYNSLSTGKFKDAGSYDKPLTDEERALFERDLKIMHDDFVQYVAESRDIPLKEVATIADGSTMLGSLALENKLIDALGDKETARAWFAEQLEMPAEEVIFCE